MIARRLLVALVGLFVAAGWTAPAIAHPWHSSQPTPVAVDQPAFEAADHDGAGIVPETSSIPRRRSGPSPLALVVGAVVLLGALPGRRRIVAVTLVLLLGALAFEGVAHAALHLGHLPHVNSLALGPSPGAPAATVSGEESPDTVALPVVGVAPDAYEPPASDVVVVTSRGRAPPGSPA